MVLTAIIKPTEACNFSCKYCYVPEDVSRSHMSLPTLEKVLDSLLAQNLDKLNIIWHGGEPLVMGAEFYKSAIEYINKNNKGTKVEYKIQTNGSLIDEEVIDLFKTNNFSVGISLDGPEAVHNTNRIYKNGKGTYNEVARGINLLKKANVNFGILTILSKTSQGHEKEIYAELLRIGAPAKINTYLPAGHGKKLEDELNLSADLYGQLLIGLYDLWSKDNSHLRLSPFEEICQSLLMGSNKICTYNDLCLSNLYISFDYKGDIFPCGRLCSIPEYNLGASSAHRLTEVLESELPQLQRRRNEDIAKRCSPCEFHAICQGGCAHDSHESSGHLFDKTPYCLGRQNLFEHIKKSLIS